MDNREAYPLAKSSPKPRKSAEAYPPSVKASPPPRGTAEVISMLDGQPLSEAWRRMSESIMRLEKTVSGIQEEQSFLSAKQERVDAVNMKATVAELLSSEAWRGVSESIAQIESTISGMQEKQDFLGAEQKRLDAVNMRAMIEDLPSGEAWRGMSESIARIEKTISGVQEKQDSLGAEQQRLSAASMKTMVEELPLSEAWIGMSESILRIEKTISGVQEKQDFLSAEQKRLGAVSTETIERQEVVSKEQEKTTAKQNQMRVEQLRAAKELTVVAGDQADILHACKSLAREQKDTTKRLENLLEVIAAQSRKFNEPVIISNVSDRADDLSEDACQKKLPLPGDIGDSPLVPPLEEDAVIEESYIEADCERNPLRLSTAQDASDVAAKPAVGKVHYHAQPYVSSISLRVLLAVLVMMGLVAASIGFALHASGSRAPSKRPIWEASKRTISLNSVLEWATVAGRALIMGWRAVVVGGRAIYSVALAVLAFAARAQGL